MPDRAPFAFLDYREAAILFDRFGVPKVPELYVGPYDRDLAISLAEGPSMVPGADNVREGCVVRPIRERVDLRLGRTVLKIVGNGYLERAKMRTGRRGIIGMSVPTTVLAMR